MYNFDVKKVVKDLINWIRLWFEMNGEGCNAVIGISGGTDSSVVAALCVEALGKDRVVGVLMPNGEQSDIEDSIELVDHLGIPFMHADISDAYKGVLNSIDNLYVLQENGSRLGNPFEISSQTKINLAPRVRMSTLYAISQSLNGRVANTCNLSEDWIGYSTIFGDSVGDFSPLSNLTKTEVKEIGKELGLPDELVYKVPSDGLCGKTDEENFGFSYDMLDKYIRTGAIDDENIKMKIDDMHRRNMFKLEPMASFEPFIQTTYTIKL